MKNLAIMLAMAFALVSCHTHRDHYYYETPHPQQHPAKLMPKSKKHHPKKAHKKRHAPKKHQTPPPPAPHQPVPVGPLHH